MQVLELDALDTLFFRNGKPFEMEDESWAEGIFPPFPSVIYGALRSAYFAQKGSEFVKANKGCDPTIHLTIKNFYLKSGSISLFPMPLDCVKEKDDGEDVYHILQLKNDVNALHSQEKSQCVLIQPESLGDEVLLESATDELIDQEQLSTYLQFQTIESAYNLRSFVSKEKKVGIGKDKFSGTSSDTGQLYRVTMNRPSTETDRITFVVEYSGLDLSRASFLKLGGEGKVVSCSESAITAITPPDSGADTDGFFKIYLATPAIFEKGWYPELENIDILAGAVGKPIPVGGFDMKSKYENGKWRPFPKPLRYAVPAGSVYYCKGDIGDAIEKYHGKTISKQRGKEGFGIAFVGKMTEITC